MELVEITNKLTWEDFLTGGEIIDPPFFQSWYWGDVQERLGHRIFRFGIYKKNTLTGVCLAVEIKAKRGHYLHLRHGPVLLNFAADFPQVLKLVKKKAQEIEVSFIRMSAQLPADSADRVLVKQHGFRNAPIHNMDAENAWVLPLSPTDAELLSGMRKTTRYLVRKAEGMPIEIIEGKDKIQFGEFMKLYEETSRRHHFVPHRGILEEFEAFAKEDLMTLFLAKYEGEVIAGAFIVFYGNQAVYHHGATSSEHKEIPAAYLLQWKAILEAKKRGKTIYNFWGVVPPEKPKHPWQGLSLFKMGFGGERREYIHAQDLPLKPSYWITYIIEQISRKRKGY